MPHTNEALAAVRPSFPRAEVSHASYDTTCAMWPAPAVFFWKAGEWLQRSARRMDAWLARPRKVARDAQSLERDDATASCSTSASTRRASIRRRGRKTGFAI